MYIAYSESSPVIHGIGGRDGLGTPFIRLCRLLVGAWLRSVERRTETALRQLDHAGLLEDFQASRRDCTR
jgi:hypothetical protein